MADPDTRMLHFTTPFGMEAHTPLCKALSAPGLREIYGNLPGPSGGGNRRAAALANGGVGDGSTQAAPGQGTSKKA